MNILITGTSGKLGGFLSSSLEHSGHKIFKVEGRKNFLQRIVSIFDNNKIDWLVHCGFSIDFSPWKHSRASNLTSINQIVEVLGRHTNTRLLFVSAAGVFGVGSKSEVRGIDDFGECDQSFSTYSSSQYIKDKILAEDLLAPILNRVSIVYPSTISNLLESRTHLALQGVRVGRFVFCPPGGSSSTSKEVLLSRIKKILQSNEARREIVNSENFTYLDKAIQLRGRRDKFIYLTVPKIFLYLVRLIPLSDRYINSRAILSSSFGYKFYTVTVEF